MSEYTFSVIIPAHNEEKYIGKCLQAVKSAAKYVGDAKTEIIVVANRCTDKTVAIARHYGAKVVINEEKCIAAIRNAGVREAKGEIIVTIDADSLMTKYSLREIKFLLDSGNYVGGGTNPKFDRMSVGIAFSSAYVAMNLIPIMMKNGGYLSGAMFWLYKRDFDAIGGFDETLVSLEDMDSIIRQGKELGTYMYIYTGGEPLVHSNILSIIDIFCYN